MAAVIKSAPTPYSLWRLILTYRTLLGKLLLPLATIIVLLVITIHRDDDNNDSGRSAPGNVHVIIKYFDKPWPFVNTLH